MTFVQTDDCYDARKAFSKAEAQPVDKELQEEILAKMLERINRKTPTNLQQQVDKAILTKPDNRHRHGQGEGAGWNAVAREFNMIYFKMKGNYPEHNYDGNWSKGKRI